MQRQRLAKTSQPVHHSKSLFNSRPVVPTRPPLHPILQLQQTIGNQAVQRLLRAGVLQAKLRIGQPGDLYEQEADRVAGEVMRSPGPVFSGITGTIPSIQKKCAACAIGQGLCPQCAEEEKEIQRKPLAGPITPLVQRQLEVLEDQ